MQKIEALSPETQSADIVLANQIQLGKLFPEAVKEGGIDFDILRQLLGEAVDERDEKWGLNWHGKRKARQAALVPSTGTLRPCVDESLEWEKTKNLVIEGDNLEVLKLLQKSYHSQISVIYIDPPYNTGNDFIYPDSYAETLQTYLQYTGQTDSEGKKFSTNTESSGRFHSSWLSMMYPRLFLARNLLRDDGVIYVNIGDNELDNLCKICDEIFGEENLLAILTRVAKLTSNKGTHFSPACDYVLAYAKDVKALPEFVDSSAQEDEDYVALFRYEDKRGKYNEVSLYMPGLDLRPNQRYYIECPDGSKVIPPEGKVYRWTPDTLKKNLAEDRVVFKKTKTSPLLDEAGKQAKWNIYTKIYLHERLEKGLRPYTLLDNKKFTNSCGSKELISLGIDFPFSKPWELIAHLTKILGRDVGANDVILDFFAGSGTTGQAVVELNRLDGGNRRFILVQLPEEIEDHKDFKVISDLTKERLRRVKKKIEKENPLYKGDLGFRVFKLASSNIRAWEPDRTDIAKSLLDALEHLNSDRSDSDILFELLLKLGLNLTVPIDEKAIHSHTVFSIGAGTLMVCLSKQIKSEDVEKLAMGIISWHKELSPIGESTCVFRDSAFADDVSKTNLSSILEQYGLDNVRSL